MRARTKLHRRVEALSRDIPKITEAQTAWAYEKCLPHVGYANKSSAFCLDCGATFPVDIIKLARATCPKCATCLTIERTRKTTWEKETYFAITHVVEEFQVVRHFHLMADYKKGRPARRWLAAVLEEWILPDGKVQPIGLVHNLNWYNDSWSGNWEIRQAIQPGGYHRGRYIIYPRAYHPGSKFKPEYRKIGIGVDMLGVSIPEAVNLLPGNPKAETLLKAKQLNLLIKCVEHSGEIHRRWPSIKICLRNKYKVKDAGLWLDYIDLLDGLGKDLRNAVYVCPVNLKAAHNRLVSKKQELQRKRDLERRRNDIQRAEPLYATHIKPFIGLQFTNGIITIKVLESVQEFFEEGATLKHCVFTNAYYKKQDRLILSARIHGKPVETIELSLQNWKIEQSRGLQNKATEHNETIISLVKRNMAKIQEVYKAMA